MFLRDCYKNQKICNKAIVSYAHVLEVVDDCYKSQKVCDKALHT